MRRKLFFNVLFLSTILVSGQNIVTLTPLHQIEYECMPGQTSYTKDLTDKWLFTNLVKNTQYRISLTSPIIFDAVVLHMNTTLWEIIDHSDPYFQIWKWLSGTIHKDTIDCRIDLN